MKAKHSGPAIVDELTPDEDYTVFFRYTTSEGFSWEPLEREDGTKFTRHETAELFRAAADVLDDETVSLNQG